MGLAMVVFQAVPFVAYQPCASGVPAVALKLSEMFASDWKVPPAPTAVNSSQPSRLNHADALVTGLAPEQMIGPAAEPTRMRTVSVGLAVPPQVQAIFHSKPWPTAALRIGTVNVPMIVSRLLFATDPVTSPAATGGELSRAAVIAIPANQFVI